MKATLLNAYNLLLASNAEELHSAAMELRRLLNGEVVVNNESMTLEDYCSFAASAIVQFEDNWRSHAGDESWPNVMAIADWDENFLVWLNKET